VGAKAGKIINRKPKKTSPSLFANDSPLIVSNEPPVILNLPTRTRTVVPPIKCQGIKSKLVKFISQSIRWSGKGRWIEPFLGSGVVLFNVGPEKAIAADTNKHIIRIYSEIKAGSLDESIARDYLEESGKTLLREGEDFYYQVRDRFNSTGSPLDFLFLSRACFNGLMRFNKKGGFNVPFCRKPHRFRPALITKICNQIKRIREIVNAKDWTFTACDWRETLRSARPGDFVYCDPPYIGRHTDYFNSWGDKDATLLAQHVQELPCGFAVSMWMKNKYRTNEHMTEWGACEVKEFSHFYHIGSTESLRNEIMEALILRSE